MGETQVLEDAEGNTPSHSDYTALTWAGHWARSWRSWVVGILVVALVSAGVASWRAAGQEPKLGPRIAAAEFLYAKAKTCSKAGQNCLKSECCIDETLGCYTKNDFFATCHPTCVPGLPDPHDKGKLAKPWNCTLLGKPPKPTPPPGPANSGCLIEDDGKILVVKHTYGVLDIPGGTTEGTEPPALTAERETFEETGYHVKASELKQVTPNGFHIYYCHLLPPYRKQGSPDAREVEAVIWLDKKAIWSSGGWRFPDEVSSFE
mmetsp:Transcript_53476/g.165515  ORF Transcript_53476/g.165515 Transcript_53476/m.165515 type:complete len:262 (+) Transcript_53476:60-845(+)